MRRNTVAFITLVSSLVVAACSSDRDTTAPRSIAPSQARADLVTTWPVCDGPTLNKAARAYFKLQSDIKLVQDFSQAPTATGALNVLKREGDVRYTPNQVAGSFAAGGTLATQAAVCGGLASDLLGPTDFNPSAALQGGIFAVMQATQTSAFVLAYNNTRGSDPYTGAASPIWGIEGVWPGGTTLGTETRYLVYGYPTGTGPAAPFEIGTIPASFDASAPFGAMTVAECINSSVNNNTQANLFHHNLASNILTLKGAGFCVGHVASAASPFQMLGRRLAALLSPKPAYAQFSFSGTGGGDGSWGNWGIDTFTGAGITLNFASNLTSPQFTGTPVQVTVNVTGQSSPLAPVNVRLTIVGNHGDPTGFYTCTSTDPSSCDTTTLRFSLDVMAPASAGTTSSATFYFEFAKAGGTDVRATGYVGGGTVQTGSVDMPQVQVQNK